MRDKIDFTKLGFRYKLGFDKREAALSKTVTSEPRPFRLSSVDCIS